MVGSSESVLARIEARGGSAPRVRLVESGAELTEPAPSAPSEPESGKYQLLGEIGRGGVGEVLKGRDVDLCRDVAIKVLRSEHVENRELVRRFVEEAQVGGQLQHPGVVPVYELGLDPDRRPYFAMKLVEGRTLAALLRERSEPASEQRRFLRIFEQVCHTVAYAHARGVVHRDLKPANVMVGAFGEVQVVDWGFAKVLPLGGIADEERAGRPKAETVVSTVRTESGGEESLPGAVMGTPAYMPPEQALGRVEELDERSDVFALGAILSEILTGSPPYAGDTREMLLQAARSELGPALERLDASGADREIVEVAKSCLAPIRRDRPRDAGVLAERISAHLAAAEERAHRSEVEAATARAAAVEAGERAEEARRSRRQLRALGAAVLLAVLVAGGSFLYLDRSRAARRASASRNTRETMREARLRQENEEWPFALAAARRAADLCRDADPSVRREAEALLAEVTEAEDEARRIAEQLARDDALAERLDAVWQNQGPAQDELQVDDALLAAFLDHGMDLEAMPPGDAAELIAASSRRDDVVAILDVWASMRRTTRILSGKDHERIEQVARLADPDEWRNRLRRAANPRDLPALQQLRREAEERERPARSLGLLAWNLFWAADPEAALEVYRRARSLYPRDAQILRSLCRLLPRFDPPRWEEQARGCAALVALYPNRVWPRRWYAKALRALGREDEEAALLDDARRLAPGNPVDLNALGEWLLKLGKPAEAAAAYRDATALAPDDVRAWTHLGLALSRMKKPAEAREAWRAAAEIGRISYLPLYNLGLSLRKAKRPEEALEALRRSIEDRSDFADAHAVLGNLYRWELRDPVRAREHLEEAIRIDPDVKNGRRGLAALHFQLGEYEAAIAQYRAMLERGREFGALNDLAWLFATCEDDRFRDAREALRLAEEAVALAPRRANAYGTRAAARYRTGDHEGAVADLEKALSMRPDGRPAAINRLFLAMALWRLGRVDDARAARLRAVRWVEANDADDQVRRCRAEADALIGE
ncbi:MAG: protein kinase domain-containing protein [Planctomycetota bacterium]